MIENQPQDKGAKIIQKFDKLKARRHNWERHWQEVAEYIVPKKDNIFGEKTAGEKKFNLLYDSTSVQANDLLASALHGMLTNPASVWFGLSTGVSELDQDGEVRAWLQHVVDRIIQRLNQGNFQSQIHEMYVDLGSFGTSYMRVLEDDKDIVRFESRPIYEALISEDFRGMVDTVYYEYEMTAQQIEQQFGEKVMDHMLLEKLRDDPLHKEKVIHAVEPRDQLPFKNTKVPENMPFASYHVLRRTHVVLKEKGFHENPNVVPRWTKISGEIYGRSPGMKALADIKMLNKMKKATIEAAQLVIAPPLQVPDDGVLLPIRTAPNSINYYRAGTKDRIEPIVTGNRIDLGEQVMESVRNQIREAYFIDQLQMVQQDRMTTTEVLHRRDEQLRLLGPILGRLNSELLRPLIDRVFGIMLRRDQFDEAPAALAGTDLEIRYVSQIAKAQMTSEAQNVTRALEFMAPFFESKPEIMDNFDADGMVKYSASIFGIPELMLTNERDKDAIRQGRAEGEAQQASAQDAQTNAQTAKLTSEAAQ